MNHVLPTKNLDDLILTLTELKKEQEAVNNREGDAPNVTIPTSRASTDDLYVPEGFWLVTEITALPPIPEQTPPIEDTPIPVV